MITTLIAESVAEGRKGFLDYLAQTNVKPQKDGQKDDPLEPQGQKDDVEEKIIELVEEKVIEDGGLKKAAKLKEKEEIFLL